MLESKEIYGGIEGGGTQSIIHLYDKDGQLLAEVEGPSTSHWLVGMDECQRRLFQMVQEAKQKAQLPEDLKLKSLGLSLSGCEEESTNRELEEGLRRKYPGLAEHYSIESDSVGSIMTMSDKGGMVIIAGTGSNSLLLNSDGTTARCGGWGHMLGDEGGAWWISHKAIKTIIDEEDNLRTPPHDTAFIKSAIFDHFGIKDRFGLLDPCYNTFSKTKFAALCSRLADGASAGDKMCLYLFHWAGQVLGEHVAALVPSTDKTVLEGEGGIPIACVGSVWKSWEYLKDGFIEGTQRLDVGRKRVEKSVHQFTLHHLTTRLAAGATYLGAKKAGYYLPRDYSKNCSVFFQYRS